MIGMLMMAMATTVASAEFYMYPAPYEHGDGLGATVNEEAVAELLRMHSYADSEERWKSHVEHRIDLNNDGKAEVFVSPPRVDVGTAGGWLDIYALQEGEYVSIGSIPDQGFRLGRSKKGYARLLVNAFLGHRTNPTYVVHVLAFDGESYVSEHSSHMSHGQMRAKGLEAYRKGKYELAEKWFLSIWRRGGGVLLHDENNLAVVYLQTGRYQAALDLLVSAREEFDRIVKEDKGKVIRRAWKTSDVANMEYNFGKAYEGLKNLPSAWKHYYAAFELQPTEARRSTLTRLIGEGVDTSGYVPIWEHSRAKKP